MICAHRTLRHGTLSHWTLEIDGRAQREVVWRARGVDGTEALASAVMGRSGGSGGLRVSHLVECWVEFILLSARLLGMFEFEVGARPHRVLFFRGRMFHYAPHIRKVFASKAGSDQS